MKKENNIIYYMGGCYGTFIEWSYYYFLKEVNFLPFTENGSSHKYLGNFLHPSEKLFTHIHSNYDPKVSRCAFDIFKNKEINLSYYEIINKDLTFLKTVFNKILVVHPSPSSIVWVENNIQEKCILTYKEYDTFYKPYGYNINYFKDILETDYIKRLKLSLEDELDPEKPKEWNKTNLYELDIWEFRELLSYYWTNRHEDQYTCWEKLSQMFKEINFISLDDLRNDPLNIIKSYLEYFGLENIDSTQIKKIVDEWKPKQTHMFKDETINTIVNCLIENKEWEWKNITFLDEVYIQKKLFDNGIGIKCHNLNKFPTNTNDFKPLLYKL